MSDLLYGLFTVINSALPEPIEKSHMGLQKKAGYQNLPQRDQDTRCVDAAHVLLSDTPRILSKNV